MGALCPVEAVLSLMSEFMADTVVPVAVADTEAPATPARATMKNSISDSDLN